MSTVIPSNISGMASAAVLRMHSLSRLGGVDLLVVSPSNASWTVLQTPMNTTTPVVKKLLGNTYIGTYLFGILAPPIILTFIFVVWMTFIACMPYKVLFLDGGVHYEPRPSTRSMGSKIIILLIILSYAIAFGFFFDAALQSGQILGAWDGLVNSGVATSVMFNTMGQSLSGLGQLLAAGDVVAAQFATACAGHSNITTPTSFATMGRPELDFGASFASGFSTGLYGVLSIDGLRWGIASLAAFGNAVGAILCILTIALFVGMALYTRRTPSNSSYNKTFTFVFFAYYYILIILLTCCCLFLTFGHIVTQFTSDICAPNVDAQVGRLVLEANVAFANADTYYSTDMINTNILQEMGANNLKFAHKAASDIGLTCQSAVRNSFPISDSLCYVMTCEGTAPYTPQIMSSAGAFQTNAVQIATFMMQRAQASVDNGPTLNTTFDVPNPAMCDMASQGFISVASMVGSVLTQLAQTPCAPTQLQYRAFVHDNLCNGFTNKFIITNGSFIAGLVCQMIGFLLLCAWGAANKSTNKNTSAVDDDSKPCNKA